MTENAKQQAQNVLSNLGSLLPELESVYKDIHSHPELSMQEKRTAGIAADRLRSAGYEVTIGIGKTGVVGYSAMVTVQPSCSEPIWTRCRFVRQQVCHMQVM
jgi:metal-dependent amidase/aminoacylase/carboxypeptidase family protein